MVMVREVAAADWRTLRDIRLAALTDAPEAFASTYAREAVFAEADWRAWIASGGTFFAFTPDPDPAEPAGLAAGYITERGTLHLVSMWVRPRARGHGVGVALIDAVLGWAKTTDADAVHLWVNEANATARRLYERCGFTLTGDREPLPSNPHLTELAMVRPL